MRDELVSRCGRNAAYSARAMARDLDISAAFFSQIISGRRALSESRASELAGKLRWNATKRKVFVKLVHLQFIEDETQRRQVISEVKKIAAVKKGPLRRKYHDLSHDEFQIVSEWFHFAIVELAGLQELPDASQSIAARLGISNLTALQAIERLVRVGLLIREDGLLRKSKPNYRMGSVSSVAIRTFHRDQLKKAAAAIEAQPVDSRDFSGTTIGIDIKKLPRAKALIRRFQDELSELLESGPKTAVFHLAIQLYRLDHEVHP